MSGPTPPGTGVIADATWRADSKSTSPTIAPSTTLIPTSTTTAPRRSIAPVTRPGWPAATTTISASLTWCGEVARPRVADRDRRVLADEQERRRHADDGRPADDDGALALDLDAGPAQDLDRGVGGRRQEAVVAEAQEAGVERVDPVDVLGRIDRVDDRPEPDRRRQRHLDDDPGDGRVGVERARSRSSTRALRTPRRRSRRGGRRCRPSRSRAGSGRGRPSTARRGRR